MSVERPKRGISGHQDQTKRPPNRPRLVFDEPHKFRAKSEHALSHLRQGREFLPCRACMLEAHRRTDTFNRPRSSPYGQRLIRPRSFEQRPSTVHKKKSRSPPSQADLERLSQPKIALSKQISDNCNWNNFIKKRSKYAIKTPYALCNLTNNEEHSETRPPFVNYGGRYDDKQHGEKRTFNALAIHQLKHRESEEERLADLLRERRLRLQEANYFREIAERDAYAQELRDRASRASTEYRDNYRPPQDYNGEGTFSRH